MNRVYKHGFTLIEVIIVIAVIVFLATVIFVAVDPARRVGEARNAVRASDVENIKKAIEYYVGEYHALPPALANLTNGTNYMLAASGDTTGASVSCAAVGSVTKVDITNGAVGLFNFLPTIPIDPEQDAPYTNGSGYYFQKQGNKITDIKPCNVYTIALEEDEEVIAVCGNGIVEGSETCDAGVNNLSANTCGANPACQVNNSLCVDGYYCQVGCTTCLQCTASCAH